MSENDEIWRSEFWLRFISSFSPPHFRDYKYVSQYKRRQRNTSSLADNHFTDSRKTDIDMPHVEQHLLFCCSCWIGRPFIWTTLEGFLSRAAWLPALLQDGTRSFPSQGNNPLLRVKSEKKPALTCIPFLNCSRHCQERILDVDRLLSARFEERDAYLFSVSLQLFLLSV